MPGFGRSLAISDWYPETLQLPRSRLRYWMPALPSRMRKFSFNTKSRSWPPRQMRKVFCLAGFAAVLSPRMAPSRTDHNRGSPSQPVRSWPLKMATKPSSAMVSALSTTAPLRIDDTTASENQKSRPWDVGTSAVCDFMRFDYPFCAEERKDIPLTPRNKSGGHQAESPQPTRKG